MSHFSDQEWEKPLENECMWILWLTTTTVTFIPNSLHVTSVKGLMKMINMPFEILYVE